MTAVSTAAAAAERNMNHKEEWGTAKKRERSNINQRKSNKNNLKKEIN